MRTIDCGSCRSATALLLVVLVLGACCGRALADVPGYSLGPAHAATPAAFGQCTTMWDPDGAGPGAPLFVVGRNGAPPTAWDGSSFVSFGGSVAGTARCLAVYNGQLYLGGAFRAIGSDSVTNLARWDGSHWRSLGTGFDASGDGYNPKGVVNALLVHGGLLYIGGSLVPNSTLTWNSTATWNGTTLQPDRTLQAPISSLEEIGGQMYATTTHNVPGVYRYDASTWTRFGNLANTSILTLTSYNSDLICAGDFTHFFTGTNMPGIARWTGTQWAPLGAGLGPVGCEVTALAVYNGSLVAAGAFTTAGGATVHNVARWDGTQWYDMAGGVQFPGGGLTNGVEALAPLDAELVATGNFTSAANRPVRGIARWNGDTWLAFHPGINAPVRAFAPSGSGLYAGGDFQFDWGSSTLRHVVGYDGTDVNALAGLGINNGIAGTVRALALHTIDPFTGSELVAGGVFSQAGDVAAQNVAAYLYPNGWSPLGSGLDGTVNAVASYGGAIYAAGAFGASGTTTLHNIAKFSNGNWIDPGFHSFLTLNAMSVIGGKLVIGGRFGGKPFTPPSDGVTTWDGTTLSLAGTADGPVYALAGDQGDIIAAGAFTNMDGVPTPSGIARRNATTGVWSAMGAAFASGVPYALAVYDGHVWVGGSLMQTPAASFGRIFMWNGSTWVGTLGVLDGTVYALAPLGSRLQIGGDFQRTDAGLESPYWIQLNDGVLAADPAASRTPFAAGAAAPNPAHGVSRVEFALERAQHARITIVDVTGRQIRELSNATFAPGPHTAAWDGDDAHGHPCAAGLYFYRIDAGEHSATRRVALLR